MDDTRVHVGTAGWHYRHWIGTFYRAGLRLSQMFDFYQRYFDTVELNNSFYRLPTPQAFATWRDAAPANFLFAVKASRYLTHNKKLKEPEQALQNLLPRVEVLGNKLGPILFQLPPRWTVNVERLGDFLQSLPYNHRYAFEFREPSWNTEPVYEVLRRHQVAYCIHELAGFRTPVLVTADFVYARLHGPGNKYQGSYTQDDLRAGPRGPTNGEAFESPCTSTLTMTIPASRLATHLSLRNCSQGDERSICDEWRWRIACDALPPRRFDTSFTIVRG